MAGTGTPHTLAVAQRQLTAVEQGISNGALDAGALAWRLAPSGPRVALVHLGNRGALGTTRRVEVWRELLGASGLAVSEVNLLAEHRRLVPSPLTIVPSLSGRVVFESATWSVRAAERGLRALGPDAIVFVTPRAFHPRLAGLAPRAVLDFQDRFSRSYRGRAAVERRPVASSLWRTLGWATDRFERRDHRVPTATAGWSEARESGATWVPNTVSGVVPGPLDDRSGAPYDLVFFGKLSALPNVDALRSLARLWPRLTVAVPGISCLVAGNDPTEEIRGLARAHGWVLEADFAEVSALCAKARVSVVPLRYANGIQNKVLEAAAAGLPQVVSPQALGGTEPGFPAVVAATERATIEGIAGLLANPERRVRLARAARDHVATHYSVERWAPVARALVTH